MRVLWVALGMLAMTGGAGSARAELPMAPGQLVREVVYNEQNDHQRHGFWQYWVEKRSRGGSSVQQQVETADGPVSRLTLTNGRALSSEAERQEQERLERLLTSRDEQVRQMRQFDEDEERIGRILTLLPTAFVYTYDGEEKGCYRLRFRPNPDDPSRSIESRIFHAMSGTLWVDARAKRLSRLEGHVDQNVDFGFGILGRLYRDGWFRLVRVQVSPADWKTESLEVHMNIRALLVKSFARDTSEVRGGFEPVQSGMSLAEGLAVLNRARARTETDGQQEPPARSINASLAPAALAMAR
ncbi:MAG: hypothetical protein ACLQG3_12795 [Terracidiphilus sp.]